MSLPRVGIGYDVHRLEPGRKMILGGVHIPSDVGPAGHSDADVLVHAIMDALLGAASMRDIGFHFPDKDPVFMDADSRMLLRKVTALLHEAGYRIGNVDATVCLEQPKIAPYIDGIIKQLASDMQVETGNVSVKATTSEGLGFTGRHEGISAMAVALIVIA